MNKGQLAVRLKDEGQTYEDIVRLMNLKDTNSARRLVAEGRDSGAKKPDRTKPTHFIIPDTQCKPGVPLEHLRWAGQYAAERRPDLVLHLGDHWDLPSLSSYESRGSRYFEGKRYLADVEAGNRGLELFEEGLGGWQPKRKVLLRGNHEFRGEKAVNEDPKLEGLIGEHLYNDRELGWEPIEFLRPEVIDGIHYAHYFYNPLTGRAYSGSIDNMLRNLGFSFTMGHRQGRWIGARELNNGDVQRGLVAGSFYEHIEDYKGWQGNHHWRGLFVCHEVERGNYDIMEVGLDYLRRRYG